MKRQEDLNRTVAIHWWRHCHVFFRVYFSSQPFCCRVWYFVLETLIRFLTSMNTFFIILILFFASFKTFQTPTTTFSTKVSDTHVMSFNRLLLWLTKSLNRCFSSTTIRRCTWKNPQVAWRATVATRRQRRRWGEGQRSSEEASGERARGLVQKTRRYNRKDKDAQ